MDQVQCTMAVTGMTSCQFIVWTPKDLCVVTVPFDAARWMELEMAAVTFFHKYVSTEIITQRLKSGMSLLGHDGKVADDQEWSDQKDEVLMEAMVSVENTVQKVSS